MNPQIFIVGGIPNLSLRKEDNLSPKPNVDFRVQNPKLGGNRDKSLSIIF